MELRTFGFGVPLLRYAVLSSNGKTWKKEPPEGGTPNEGALLVDILWIGSLVEFDVGAPRVGDEGQRRAGLLILRVGPVELDAVGFKLLDEALQVLHVEADVVEHASLGGRLRHFGLVEAQLH